MRRRDSLAQQKLRQPYWLTLRSQLKQVSFTTLSRHSPLPVGCAGAAIAAVNQNIDPVALQHVMANFSREMEKVSVAEESWNDVVDLFDGEGVDEEADEVVDQVLDELGIEIGQKLDQASCPTNSVHDALYDEVSAD
jgi:charged multivesicular body protein 2A